MMIIISLLLVSAPPVAPVKDVVTDYQGVTIHDPYRWLEDTASPESQAWLKGQDVHARASLDRIKGLATLRTRIEELDGLIPLRVWWPMRTDAGALFTLQRKADEELGKLYVRPPSAHREGVAEQRLLFDPDENGKDKRLAINGYAASPDGSRVVMLVGPADGEICSVKVRDTKTAKDVDIGTPIDGIWGELTPSWRDDGSGFFYSRKSIAGTPHDPKNMFGKMKVYERKLDGSGSADVAVFGFEVEGAPAAREKDWPFLYVNKRSPYALGFLWEGVGEPARIYAVDKKHIGKKDAAWRQIVDEKLGVRDWAQFGRWLYVKSFADGASRFRVLRFDLADAAAKPIVVVDQQKGVIEQITAAADGIYVVVRTGAVSELYVVPHDATGLTDIARYRIELPYSGAVSLAFASPTQKGVLFDVRAWTRPLQTFAASNAQRKAENLGLMPIGAELARVVGDVTSEEAFCTAKDGAQVPMSIIGPKKEKRDKRPPVLMYGYGGYGMTATANFNPTMVALYEQGGVHVVVNPRGSGAFGEDWYRAGVGATKENTWNDMIACAETLIQNKVTTPTRLGIWGISMGGVAVGRSVTTRPDLFRVAIMQVGMLDTIRGIEISANGPNHEIEMGTLKTRAGVEQLLKMSSYHHVVDGTQYPAVLVIHGIHDNRVDPWSSFKMAARLQAATRSKQPVLLRVDMDAGHGVTMTAAQRNAQWADTLAFFLSHVGARGFGE